MIWTQVRVNVSNIVAFMTVSESETGGIRPVRRAMAALLSVWPELAPHLQKATWRAFYELASMRRGNPQTAMMNYGYAAVDEDGATSAVDSADHYGLQLYAAVAGAADLTGQDVLEVGCGRGGGAAFVFERFGPRSVTGLDLARQAVDRCRRRYGRAGVSFVAGDAEQLPFADGWFDAVLSVESSHCYAHPARFWSEAHRVLRPGGRLLLADLRHTHLSATSESALFARDDVAGLRDQLAMAGFRTVEEQDITANVVHALELDTPARRRRIERRVPRFLRSHVLTFAAIEGSPMYSAFADGELRYMRFVLERI
jgi:SAM-dependent methyltransferase